MIVLAQDQYEQILKNALKNIPNEACGLLGGIIEGEKKLVKRVYLLTNIDVSPEHFSMDPKEQFSAVKDMRKNNWVMLGNFHSHPATPSRPSEEDERLAFDPDASYLILSLAERANPILKGFRINRDTVIEENIEFWGR